MSPVDRFTVSLDIELLAAFDRNLADRGYENRSEAIRDLIRDTLTAARLHRGVETVSAVLTVVVDHGVGDVAQRLRSRLSADRGTVAGSLVVGIDDRRDHMAIVLRGRGDRIREVADAIQSLRGVYHGQLAAVPAPDNDTTEASLEMIR